MSMDSSGSSSNFVPRSQIRCFHNEIAPLRVVRHQGPRVGLKFYGCVYWPRTCRFFHWADEVTNDVRIMLMQKDETIAELQHEKKALLKQVKALTLENKQLEEEYVEVLVECEHRRSVMCVAKADKKMGFYLVMTWIL
ncbi:DNA topoisomerase 3-alpha, partial [Bienertia sinuspersici]